MASSLAPRQIRRGHPGLGAVEQTDVRGSGFVPIVAGRRAQLAEVTSGGVAQLLLLIGWVGSGATDGRRGWCRCGVCG